MFSAFKPTISRDRKVLERCSQYIFDHHSITVISSLSSEDSDDLKKILSFSTPRFYLDLIEKSSNLCLWFSLTIFHTLSLQTCLLYCQVEKPRPVSMVQTVWFYDLCGIHNRCSKSKARQKWRGGNQWVKVLLLALYDLKTYNFRFDRKCVGGAQIW